MRRSHSGVGCGADDGPQKEFGISAHQFEAVLRPRVLSTGMIVIPARVEEFIGRPYRIWRDYPELARDLNDRLAGGAN